MSSSLSTPPHEHGTETALRTRQRQKLIEACISALYEHGPSRTTIDKVVSIAGMSPGIVNFYFDTKAAMLVAALAYLADEFEVSVLAPVEALAAAPVQALEKLVTLYLDPDIASPRKVSVWYAFWGEANSRQEYLDICGKQDDRFAVLVRDLMESLIGQTGLAHLDADAVSLGLIGALEMLWQGIAFQQEGNVDRVDACRRCRAYLNSVFPGWFSTVPQPRRRRVALVALAGTAYADQEVFRMERDHLFFHRWQFLCPDAALCKSGDYAALTLLSDRIVVVRGTDGEIGAFRNTCPITPHALVQGPAGRFSKGIVCDIDGSVFGDGAGLTALPCRVHAGGVFVAFGEGAGLPAESGLPAALPRGLGMPTERQIDADWKVIVEDWLSSDQPDFVHPNMIVQTRLGVSVVQQVLPVAPGRCRLRHAIPGNTTARPRAQVEASLTALALRAASTQIGLAGPVPVAGRQVSKAVTAFWHALRLDVPALR